MGQGNKMEARPKLRPDLEISHHQDSEGRERIVLKDPLSGKFYRVSKYEFTLLRSLDGQMTLEEAIEKLKGSGRYYNEEDAKLVLGKAAQMGLLLGTRFGSSKYQRQLKANKLKAQKAKRFSSVYFLFIPLFNPDKFLESTLWLYRIIANRFTGILALMAAPGAIYLVISGIPRIQGEYLFFFNFQNLLYLWITIALTKLVHEFAHAYTAKSYGLSVPEMGIAFLLFFPCMYCNTTDAWKLAHRRQRMAISAAGIISEAVIAVVSAYVWSFTLPGMINSIAFYLMSLSFISTVLFNGNPLMRFDGYFVLTDYLRMPNLAANSVKYLKYLFFNRTLGITLAQNPAGTDRQSRIFTIFGVSLVVYRIFLYTGIIVGVYYKFDKMIGIVLAILAFGLFIVRPVLKGAAYIFRQRSQISPRPLGLMAFIAVAIAIIAPLTAPISANSVYPCYLQSDLVRKLTVPLHTMVEEVNIETGARVNTGDLLFQLDASKLELQLRLKRTQKEIIEKEIALYRLDRETIADVSAKEIELRQAIADIDKITKDLALARDEIRAPFDGVITNLDEKLQAGFQPGEGVIVGELQSWTRCVIIGLIPAAELEKIQVGKDVKVWFPLGEGVTLNKRINAVKSYSEKDLENSPFSSRFGGEVATEIKGEQRKDAPLEAHYAGKIYHDNSGTRIPLGITGRLVVAAPPKSLIARLYDGILRTINRETLL
jgi:putative peptide zinc metalloprotease protein